MASQIKFETAPLVPNFNPSSKEDISLRSGLQAFEIQVQKIPFKEEVFQGAFNFVAILFLPNFHPLTGLDPRLQTLGKHIKDHNKILIQQELEQLSARDVTIPQYKFSGIIRIVCRKMKKPILSNQDQGKLLAMACFLSSFSSLFGTQDSVPTLANRLITTLENPQKKELYSILDNIENYFTESWQEFVIRQYSTSLAKCFTPP